VTTPTHLTHEVHSEEQKEADLVNARLTLITVLDHAKTQPNPTVALVELVEALGLQAQLDELIGLGPDAPERHRRYAAARLVADQAAGGGDV
jgi:hypothetical protein